MWFCELSLDSISPDHVTIHRWRERFIEYGIFEEVFADFNLQLEEKGYFLKDATIVDATLIKSAARPKKKTIIEVETITEGDIEKQIIAIESETSKDIDAKCSFKNGDWAYGFKGHQAVNSDGIILDVITTLANVYDGTVFSYIIGNVKPPHDTHAYADKAYLSAKNRECLEMYGLQDGLIRKKSPKQKISEEMLNFNKAISKIRFVVERTFGMLKRMFNLEWSKYLGLQKTHNWSLFGAFVHNISRARNMPRARYVQS